MNPSDDTFEPYTLDNFRRVVMTAAPAGLLAAPPKKPNELIDRVNRIVKLGPGKASGRLAGGNLTMIAATMGTPYELDTGGAIVFLEDTHEEPYRIDRMLTQLALGGKLNGIAGFLWGRCTDCEPKENSFSLEENLRDRFSSLGVPALSGVSFGHIEQKLTLPIGVMATMDGDAGRSRLMRRRFRNRRAGLPARSRRTSGPATGEVTGRGRPITAGRRPALHSLR